MLACMSLGPLEIGLIILAILLLFGAKRLPELGRGLGSGMREFKEGVTGDKRSDQQLNAGEPPRTPEQQAEADRIARGGDRGSDAG